MKRTLTSIITCIFLGFLLIGAVGVFQNIIEDIQKTFSHKTGKSHVLAYEKVDNR